MSQISIVGLGPGSFGQLTVETLELLQNENKNYFERRSIQWSKSWRNVE